MTLKYFLSGFFVKIITGLDDTMVHIPIMGTITKTRLGRIAFSTGILLAIAFAIVLSFLFASTIKLIPYSKYISAGLIFLLAIVIYFDVFIHKPREKVERKLKKIKRISVKRFFKLLSLGFIAAFATVIDDIIAYSSLFLGSFLMTVYVITGIFLATILELTVIIYFSKKIQKIPYKNSISAFGLIILGILILFEVL